MIGDSAVRPAYPQTLALTALRTLLSAREAALLLTKVTQSVSQAPRVRKLLPGAERSQVRKAKVNTHCPRRRRKRLDLDHGRERDVVTAVDLALERDRVGAGYRRQVLCGLYGAEFRKHQQALNPLGAYVLEPKAPGHSVRLPLRIPRSLSGLHPAEEVGKRLILVPETLGQTGARHLRKPCKPGKFLDLRDAPADVDAGHAFLAPLPSLSAHLQSMVPEKADRPEPLVQHPDLGAIGIATDAVGALDQGHGLIISLMARTGMTQLRSIVADRVYLWFVVMHSGPARRRSIQNGARHSRGRLG